MLIMVLKPKYPSLFCAIFFSMRRVINAHPAQLLPQHCAPARG
jgi:hypothetical protein